MPLKIPLTSFLNPFLPQALLVAPYFLPNFLRERNSKRHFLNFQFSIHNQAQLRNEGPTHQEGIERNPGSWLDIRIRINYHRNASGQVTY